MFRLGSEIKIKAPLNFPRLIFDYFEFLSSWKIFNSSLISKSWKDNATTIVSSKFSTYKSSLVESSYTEIPHVSLPTFLLLVAFLTN